MTEHIETLKKAIDLAYTEDDATRLTMTFYNRKLTDFGLEKAETPEMLEAVGGLSAKEVANELEDKNSKLSQVVRARARE